MPNQHRDAPQDRLLKVLPAEFVAAQVALIDLISSPISWVGEVVALVGLIVFTITTPFYFRYVRKVENWKYAMIAGVTFLVWGFGSSIQVMPTMFEDIPEVEKVAGGMIIIWAALLSLFVRDSSR